MGKILHGPPVDQNCPKITLGEHFFESFEKNGDKICQLDVSTSEAETNRSVKLRSVRAALAMKKRGVTSKDVICFCTNNTIDSCVPIFGAFFLNAKVASLDPTLSTKLNTHLISIASPKILFVQESSLDMIEEILVQLKLDVEIIVFGKSKKYITFGELMVPQENENEFRPSRADINEVILMFFSSGTTGLPKAICHSHYTFMSIVRNGLKEDYESLLHFTTMYWISGMLILARTLETGSTRLFASRPISDPETYEVIEKHKITSIFMSPILTYNLTNVKNPEHYDTSSLKYILTGGTAIQPSQIFKLQKIFKSARTVFGYGMTECGMIASINEEAGKPLDETKLWLRSCGQLARGVTLKISDLQTGETLDVGQQGEICIKSVGVMIGYYKLDSSNCFDQDHYLRTGDIGYFDEDGYVYVVDRLKEMFKYLSWHIVPSVIERVLLEHEAVKEAVVFGIPKGEDGDMPAAWVTLNDGFHTTSEELQQFVAKSVSDRERLRGGVAIVNYIPKTPTNKIMRREVKNMAVAALTTV